MQYNIGDSLDLTGLSVKACYSDLTEKIVSDYSVGMIDMSSVGVKTVTVYYTFGGVTKTACFEISVNAELCTADILHESVSAESVNKRVGLFSLYSRAAVSLECKAENVGDYTVRWSSDNTRVMVNEQGVVTCTGLFGAKHAVITAEVLDSQGNVVACDTVRVVFYKLPFQLSKFASQLFNKAVNALVF